MQTLIASVAVLGLAVAFSSPTSVLAVLVLLSMPSGLRRSYAFLAGWIATIALIGVALVVFPALDFHSSRSTPSRTASVAELLVGCFLVAGAVALHRRPPLGDRPPRDPMPDWLVRLVGRHWAVSLAAGGVMLTYSLTIVAILEILKANVDALDRAIALAVFALGPSSPSPPRSSMRRWPRNEPPSAWTAGNAGSPATRARSESSCSR